MQAQSFITGIILASGFGRRANCDKLMLEWQGKGILFQVMKNALFSELDEVLLIIQPRHKEVCKEYLDLFLPELQNKMKIIINENADEGMSASLRLGIANLNKKSEASLFLLGDQLFFSANYINIICNQFKKTKAEILVPYNNGERKNPVLFSSKFNEEMLTLSKDMGARKLLEKYVDRIEKISFKENIIFEDVDTQEIYSDLKQYEFSWANYLKNKKKISIIGAGGKSSLIWNIAENFNENKKKCIISTTTKMWNKAPDFVSIKLLNSLEDYQNSDIKIPLLAKKINQENKLIGFDCEEFDTFDFNKEAQHIIIEADGAKGKNYKVHSENEPCIPQSTDVAIAVIGVDCLGKKIEAEIHRHELLPKKYHERKTIDISMIYELLCEDNGYFKYLLPYNHILFLNVRESDILYKKALDFIELLKQVKEKLPKKFEGVVIGSNILKSYEFYEI